MSNGNYPSPDVAYQGVHALIGYGAVPTAAFKLHHWMYSFVVVLFFGLAKEFIKLGNWKVGNHIDKLLLFVVRTGFQARKTCKTGEPPPSPSAR